MMKMMTVITLTMMLVIGCDSSVTSAQKEAHERSSRLYSNAMDDFQAGRLEQAIKGLQAVIREEPSSVSAHFQLATLLEDVRNDYIGAISHYRMYLDCRPASDKASVASSRLKTCELKYMEELGTKVSSTDFRKEEAERTKAEREKLEKKIAELEKSLASAQNEIVMLKRDNESQHKLLVKLGGTDDDISTGPKLKAKLRPTDAELLDDDSDGETDRILSSADAQRLRQAFERQDKEDMRIKGTRDQTKIMANQLVSEDVDSSTTPVKTANKAKSNKGESTLNGIFGNSKSSESSGSRPKKYVVEEGDTLMRISAKFYNTNAKWRAIREANKAIIPPNGALRVGQEIVLP